jgi:hypothetical protein
MRLAAPDLDFVDRALPQFPAPVRNLIKDLLGSEGLRTGIPPLTSKTPGPFKPFALTRPVLLRDFTGNAFMGKDAAMMGKVTVEFSSRAFRSATDGTRSLLSSCTDCRDNLVPVQVGGGGGLEVLGFADGNFTTGGCSCAPSVSERQPLAQELRRAVLRPTLSSEWAPAGEIAEWVHEWSPDRMDALSERHRVAYGHAQQAEIVLEEAELDELTFELLAVHDEAELEEFLGKLVRKVSRTVSNVAKKVERGASAATRAIGKTPIGAVARAVSPIVGSVARLASHSPMGALARSTWGALSAAARGENILMGAVDGLAGTPLLRGLAQMGGAVLRGENVIDAAKQAVKAGIGDAREAMGFAAMVAPFVPGIGTGIGAALGAANALANGQPISDVLIAAARSAVPGGAIAQAAFDTAANLVRGQRIDQALLGAARNQLPPGPAQAAFDTGLALAQGKKLQAAVLVGAGRLLPRSPYAADALSFARRAVAGENLGQAALSTAGNAVLRRARQQGNDLIRTVQGRAVKEARRSFAVARR